MNESVLLMNQSIKDTSLVSGRQVILKNSSQIFYIKGSNFQEQITHYIRIGGFFFFKTFIPEEYFLEMDTTTIHTALI